MNGPIFILLSLFILGVLASPNPTEYRQGSYGSDVHAKHYPSWKDNVGHETTRTGSSLHHRLYKEILTKDSTRNIIYSPFSIQMCLALAHMGARGTTADEIAQVIGYSNTFNTNNLATALKRLGEQNVLQIANRAYVKSGYTLNAPYQSYITQHLQSSIKSIDFTPSTKAADNINAWIEKKTNHKIKDIIQPDMLNELTRLVLINAIYFKGNWSHQFNVGGTKRELFNNFDGTTSEVPMMSTLSSYSHAYLRTLGADVIELAYADTNIAMYLIVPKAPSTIDTLEQKIDKIDFGNIRSRLIPKMVSFSMPRFEINYDLNLKQALKDMGMNQAFTGNADFSGMLSSQETLKVSDVLHKAFIKVDEKGTEAAAVTVLMVQHDMMIYPEETLKVDRPFMFAIVSQDYDVPLFMGAVKHL